MINFAFKTNRNDFIKWLIMHEKDYESFKHQYILYESVHFAFRTADIGIVLELQKHM